MIKYGLDSFVESAILSKKRSFAPQIRQIIQEYTGTTGDNDDDTANVSNGRDYPSWDRYPSHSYGRNDRSDRYDRDHYSTNNSRRADYDSTSVMDYDVDNTEQDMEVDDSNSSVSSSSHSEEDEKASNGDSSAQARLNSFLQTLNQISRKQEQHKQKRQESDAVSSASSSDSQDVISKISSGEVTKPLTNRPAFKFNFTTVHKENNPAPDDTLQKRPLSQVDNNYEESKDNFSPQDMNLDEVSPSSDQRSAGTPLQQSDLSEDVKPIMIKCEENSSTNLTDPSVVVNSSMPPLPVVTLPPAHLLVDTIPLPEEEIEGDFDDDETSDSPKAPTPEPISPGSIDMNLETINSEMTSDDATAVTTCHTVKVETKDESTKLSPPPVDCEPVKASSTPPSQANQVEDKVNESLQSNKKVHVPATASVSEKLSGGHRTKDKVTVKKEPLMINVPNVTDIPLEEILSDVSSVHTSDLSDFDDRISISSSEGLSLSTAPADGQETLSLSVTLNSTAAPTASASGRRKISLQEVKQQLQAGERVTSASSSITSSTGSNSQGTKGKAKKNNSNVTFSAQTVESKLNTSGKGRQRKINTRYKSDEYLT